MPLHNRCLYSKLQVEIGCQNRGNWNQSISRATGEHYLSAFKWSKSTKCTQTPPYTFWPPLTFHWVKHLKREHQQVCFNHSQPDVWIQWNQFKGWGWQYSAFFFLRFILTQSHMFTTANVDQSAAEIKYLWAVLKFKSSVGTNGMRATNSRSI